MTSGPPTPVGAPPDSAEELPPTADASTTADLADAAGMTSRAAEAAATELRMEPRGVGLGAAGVMIASDGPLVSPARPSRTFDEVIRQLRDLISRREVRVGDRLPSERALAEQFQVSRNMVREALRMLEITGMIELRKGRYGGAFVCTGRPEIVTQSLADMMHLAAFSLADLTEARLWLSSTVVRVVSQRATEADLDRLAANVDAAVAYAAAADWHHVAQVNMRFHDMLAELAANPVLKIIHDSVMGVIREISLALGPIKSDATVRHRVKILEHLRQRDADAAAEEMAANLASVHEFWLREIGDRPVGSITGAVSAALRRDAG
ncbi:FadR/GntR family transcriptional regulator [Frankia sp. Cr2]|uniref:FadR/GntR family transcriptional regulator n=1 Tax=Frankia sp. Cr2 TaxID=3073932 RepID=UPI002AD423BD|nr:GntR family transcriptional regulator [Frankia sp. Cr2]